jgi:hypothetical protein
LVAHLRPDLASSLICTLRRTALQTPFLFHAQAAYSATTTIIAANFQENAVVRSLRWIHLQHYSLAVQYIRKELLQPTFQPTDAHIHAIAILISTFTDKTYHSQEPFPRSVVGNLQNLYFYFKSPLELVTAHVEGLFKVVELRGGLANIRTAFLKDIVES